LKVSIVQLAVSHGDPEKNIRMVINTLESALKRRCDVVVLPELWNATYPVTDPRILVKDNSHVLDTIGRLAKRHKAWIVAGSMAIATKRGNRNRCYVYSPDGDRVFYDKIHLYPGMKEPNLFSGGSSLGIVPIAGILCGVMICFDMEFPEVPRALGEKGAVVFFVPGAWRREHIRLWRTLLIARAIENQVFVVGVNRCDKGKNFSFGGQSMIIDPFGDVLVHLGENQTIESVSLDLSLVDEARRKNSIVSSKRPALYRKWK